MSPTHVCSLSQLPLLHTCVILVVFVSDDLRTTLQVHRQLGCMRAERSTGAWPDDDHDDDDDDDEMMMMMTMTMTMTMMMTMMR